jgi:hypothetical protein
MIGIGAWFLGAVLAVTPEASPPRPQDVTASGQVLELTEALPAYDVQVDADPINKQVVLKGEDRAIVPLLSDPASRALFLDERLRRRRVVIQGRRFEGLPYLQVVSFQVDDRGTLRTPEYYCDVCTISVRYPQVCPCCQGPMELRMKPESR